MNKIKCLIFLIILLSCNKNHLKNYDNNQEIASNKNVIELIDNLSDTKNDSLLIDLKEIESGELIGMIKMKSNSEKKVEEYGFDVTNGCYSCRMGTLKIENRNVYIHNFCDSDEITEMKIIKVEKKPYKIKIIMNNNIIFTFTKVSKDPIYELSIKGELETNLIINKYFTIDNKLSSFTIHDCGDFEG